MPLKLKNPEAKNTPDLITEKEAAALLSVRPNHLARDRWEAKQHSGSPKFPFYRVGRYVRYDKGELLALIAKSRVA